MDDMRLSFATSILSQPPGGLGSQRPKEETGVPAFSALLQQESIRFSKHAGKRVAEHGLALDGDILTRLSQGIAMAKEKQLGETLILVDRTAFLVDAKSSTVITAMESGGEKGSLFTHIDGTILL